MVDAIALPSSQEPEDSDIEDALNELRAERGLKALDSLKDLWMKYHTRGCQCKLCLNLRWVCLHGGLWFELYD
jgi:hypothetical protein